MVCEEVIREISNYIEADLDPTLQEALELHLQHCDDCRVVVNTARKSIDLYSGKEPLPLPEEVQQAIDQALANKKRRPT